MLVTSNRSVSERGTVFGNPVVATAILDRLLHRESYRLREMRRYGATGGTAVSLIATARINAVRRR
jgi:hypothetical protein